MIRYQLRCGHGHGFEGWFRDGAAFEEQARRALVICPECGDASVEKALMAPAIARRAEAAPVAETQPQSPGPGPEAMLTLLRRLRRTVEAQCENVGERFADEAMRRHTLQEQGETLPERGIYGTMTMTQRERLEDEGVEYATLPWVRSADA
ncbi:DUF1178 family protein [Acidomonas methanolica]|uniref:DUF1178 family protein n=1 Tax=Acidomonas methanolica TaxID=437 RepID=UPI00211A39F7|nr:DUF1178 family protein [Acidomonas methanolica]MCQ9154564.1 DUF1178 family protein [Acidomonas methanolica]